MNLRIINKLKMVLAVAVMLCCSGAGVFAADYVSTDDLLGVDAESTKGFLDVNDQKELGNTVVGTDTVLPEEQDDFLIENDQAGGAGIYTIAFSRNVRELCILPEDLVGKIFEALESNITDSGKFKVLSLDRNIQGELAAEVRRVVAQGVADRNAVSLGQVSGVKYIAVLTMTDFSVRRRNFPGSVRFANGALEFECGISVKFIDTSTHEIAAQIDVSAKQFAALPAQYNYVDKGTDISRTAKVSKFDAAGRWSWVGDADVSANRRVTDGYAGEDGVRYFRTINGWNVRQEQGGGYRDDGYAESRSAEVDEAATADVIKVRDKVKVKSQGSIEEDTMYKEYYRLSQENFASKALASLADKLAKKAIAGLVKEFYPVKIIKIFKEGRVAINSGSENGITQGQIMEIRSITRERDPDTGKLLSFEIPYGRVEIISVSKESSVGKIIAAEGRKINVGSVLYPLKGDADDTNKPAEVKQNMPFKQHKKSSAVKW